MRENIRVILAIQAEAIRKHFQALTAPITAEINSRGQFPRIDVVELDMSAVAQDGRGDALDAYISEDGSAMRVIIADWLVTDEPPREPTPQARICLRKFRTDAFATIAVMPDPRRVADIDRTVSPDCESTSLQRALELVIQRLEYVTAPEHHLKLGSAQLTVRLLRNNETEFRDYFALRYRIYQIMGYLDEESESCRSRLEINEADTHAIHIGAFCRIRFREVLVGTARVVTNTEENEALREMFDAMAGNDAVVRRRLDNPYRLTLPIFQSHRGMNSIMQDTFKNDQVCGELSRVTVDREYRGLGISRKLVAHALQKAITTGTRRLFLECLEIHEPLYRKHGFARLHGIEGPVVDVGRTMIAMEMEQQRIEQLRFGSRRSKSLARAGNDSSNSSHRH